MEHNSQSGLSLTAELKSEAGKALLPEEAAIFELHLHNGSSEPRSVVSINGNMYSPTVRLSDAGGKVIGSYIPAASGERTIGDLSTVRVPPPRKVTLQPGSEEKRLVNLWSLRDAAGPGKYRFDALHSYDEELLSSNSVPFEIVPGKIDSVALSYDTAARTNSVLAWLAAPAGTRKDRLLIRTSGFASHSTAQVGATSQGEFPAGSRVSVSFSPVGATFSPALGWVGVISGDRLVLIEHSMTEPVWRSGELTLPLADAVPVPRFPNRQHAVFLATGSGKQGPALAGVVAQQNNPPKQWSIPLTGIPTHSACSFAVDGPITLLFSTDDGTTSRVHRIEFNEDGSVTAPDKIVRESSNTVLAIVADLRTEAPPSFVVLEGSRTAHDEVAFAKITPAGEVRTTSLRKIAGWPLEAGNASRKPVNPAAVAFETDNTGLPWIAVIDPEGESFGGRMDGAVMVMRNKELGPASFPQVAAIAKGVTISSFNPDGTLFHSGGAAGH